VWAQRMVEVFSDAHCRSMELTTILNRCHRFKGFIYQHARFTPDKKAIEISVRPRKGSAVIRRRKCCSYMSWTAVRANVPAIGVVGSARFTQGSHRMSRDCNQTASARRLP
jgi:hypothetical protein